MLKNDDMLGIITRPKGKKIQIFFGYANFQIEYFMDSTELISAEKLRLGISAEQTTILRNIYFQIPTWTFVFHTAPYY